jgi:hypothetical protein
MTDTPAGFEVIDGVPMGWSLGRESWTAHRMFYRQTGRTMVFREYSRLMRARGADAECLNKRLGVWRVTGDQGEIVIVQRSRDKIRQVLPLGRTAPSKPVPAQRRPKPKASSPPAVPAQAEVRPLTANELRRRLGVPVV